MDRKGDEYRLTERQVAEQVREWFAWHKWRCLRHNVGLAFDQSGGKVFFGEKGMADLMFLYYLPEPPAATLTVWVETKRPGGVLSPAQVDWQRKEMARGGCVVTIDNFEFLRDWYSERFGWLHQPGGPGEGNLLEFNP